MDLMHVMRQQPVLDEVRCVPLRQRLRAPDPRGRIFEYVLDNGDFLHFHHVIEIGLCTEGEGISAVGGKEYLYKAGNVQIVFPRQPHFTLSTGTHYSKWKWIFIDPSELNERLTSDDSKSYGDLLQSSSCAAGIFGPERHPEAAEAIRQFFDAIAEENGEIASELAFLALFRIFLLLSLIHDGTAVTPQLQQARNEKIASILRYLSDAINDGRQPGIAELARKAGYSEAHFRRIFKKTVGIGPKDYVVKLSVKKARQLLVTTSLSIEEISRRVGYNNPSCLYRNFYSVWKISPFDYRNRWSEERD